ncbi:PEP-CTERM protein-sorting domain-containing protein [Noviherbaspirillum humi]|uniref:PEP-CTERM protein-sorting domain-containing protein n=1 Tax=Noviherbaspirillum humi TaxID=1688639 RepID=A0A239KYY1_9BURK|nr:PEP-CTERM sorting domain-containing protein [Noviherbaspirillum humi]SNT22858.1 PEP-CTERM protein-sorting domain-containing protein [Noviherbaspirillum humi]
MNFVGKNFKLACMLSLLLGAGSVHATQFSIQGSDVVTNSGYGFSYSGDGGNPTNSVNDARGSVGDGGYDAFDGMGYLSNTGSLSVTRRTEAFQSLNLYRWFDTFTNNTGSTITQTINWWGNLGSDGYQTTYAGPGSSFINVDNNGYDPVGAYIYGNNTFASTSMNSSWYCGPEGQWSCYDNVNISTTLTLDAGQSASLLNFVFLARDNNDRSGDVALATNTAANLVANPYLDGLNQDERSRILNWGGMPSEVPEPGTAALLGLGLFGFMMSRRRKS